jgi:2-iminobutanoate/2-iminopropanoate deaminase
MAKQLIQTAAAPLPAGPYSQGIRAGDFIYTAGQVPIDPATGKLAGETIEEQTAQVMENLRAILEAAGASLANVVKTTVHLSDLSLFARFNPVYAGYFPDIKPARTTVGSQLSAGVLVEIDVVAYLGAD